MSNSSHSGIQHGYCVIRCLVEHWERVAVAVVVWNTPAEEYHIRWPAPGERVKEVDAKARNLMDLARSEIERWADSRKVPYYPESVTPATDTFWRAASRFLSTAVQVDPPRELAKVRVGVPLAMAPTSNLEDMAEGLYRRVVRLRPAVSLRKLDGQETRIRERSAESYEELPLWNVAGS